MSIAADYFDGQSARRQPVQVDCVPPGILTITGEGIAIELSSHKVQITDRVGSIPRRLTLPGGAVCEIADNDAVDAWQARMGQGAGSRWIAGMERQFSYAVIALVATVAIVWSFIQYGLPAAARVVAFSLPAKTEATLGDQGMEALDRLMFEKSELPIERQAALSKTFNRMAVEVNMEGQVRLEFRRGNNPKFANAFALPSGLVVLTDGLVNIAENDEEIVAVLAHELGHVKGRHTLRHILQSSATVVVISLVTGDLASSASFAAAVPTMLMELKFSRDFEREADDFAFNYLVEQRIPLVHFADILERMGAEGGKEGKGEGDTFMSSHPATDERTKRFREGR